MVPGSIARECSHERFQLSLANEQSSHVVDGSRLLQAARRVLADSRFKSAAVSLAIVDDAAIHELNRQFLAHDYPTDVLSFVLEDRDGHLEGEVVLSADTAAAAASEVGWPPADELLLYVIHGMLHLVGLRDTTEAEARQMRAAEQYYLRECGVASPEARTVGDAPATSDSAGGPGGATAL